MLDTKWANYSGPMNLSLGLKTKTNRPAKSLDNKGLHTEPRVARVSMYSEFAAAR